MPEQTPHQRFVELVYAAQDASDAVDKFDLHSEQPESVATWNELLADQQRRFRALAEHVREHAAVIIAGFTQC